MLSVHAHNHITQPAGGQNITEWAKKTACWDQFRKQKLRFPAALQNELASATSNAQRSKAHALEEAVSEAENELVRANGGSDLLPDVVRFGRMGKDTQSLETWQSGLAFSLGKLARDGKTSHSEAGDPW